MHAHHTLGFIELEPLAIGVVDLVYVIVALMCLLLVGAGWVLLYLLHITLGRISILGAHPFNFFYGLATAALKSIFNQLEQRLVATGHFFWSLAQMIWRPLFVILQTIQWLAGQIIGVQQSQSQGNAQLRAQEQTDIANLRAAEQNDFAVANSHANFLYENSIQHADNLYNDAITHADQVGQIVLGDAQHYYNLSIENADTLYNQSIAHADAVGRVAISDAEHLYNLVEGDLFNKVSSLTQADANTLTEAKNFATSAITAAEPGILAKAATAVATKLAPIQTEIDDCLTPLCDTVTPQAPRLGRLGNLLGELEALGIEALLIALAAECLTNPGGVANDVRTVVQDVGNPIMAGFRDLTGA